MPFQPDYEGEFPTLGWVALDWMTAYLARPELQEYEPLILTREQAEFVLHFYELDPVTCKRIIQRGVLSRPRGWGKSPITAAIACLEALGPVVPAGWDANGKPVGKPWSTIRKPLVELAAVSEDQVNTNSWSPLKDMLTYGPVMDAYPGLEVMEGFINLPYGRIQRRTAAAGSAKGAPAHFVVCDQTEEWTKGNGGINLYNKLKNNVLKRGGHLIESPNAYTPGDGSVAENTMAAYQNIVSGRAPNARGVMYDHREAPPDTDMSDPESLMQGLAIAYGDSADIPFCAIHSPACEHPGWVDLEELAVGIGQPDADVQVSRSDWFNQITHASDAWISQPVWAACSDASKVIADRDVVVLGFDGSRGKAKGKPDATALIGCRVNDGHIWTIGVWEAGDHPNDWPKWEVPIVEIEAELATAFSKYKVVGFYADPGKDWRSHVNEWEKKYAQKVKDNGGIQGTAAHPFEWWMTGGRSSLVERAIEQLEGAIRQRDITHDGSASLTRHVLNARRRFSHSKLALAKENDYSPNKIDAAVAAVLAYQARLDALSRVPETTSDFYVPERLY
jgi:hypothetical protein